MNKRVMKTAEGDRLILADVKELLLHCDQGDLNCRDSQIVDDLYHPEWFFEHGSEEYFKPPAIYIVGGVIKFINGRHRTILLSRYLNMIPLLVGNLDMDHLGGKPSQESIEVLNKITVKQIPEHTVIENFPELDFGRFSSA